MKTNYKNKLCLKLGMIAAFLAINFHTIAQEQYLLGSSVRLSTELNGEINKAYYGSEMISLSDQSNSFTAWVCLFPIVNNPDKEDSLAEENNLLELTFTGHFPIENFSYYFNINDNNIYNMNGLLTVNGISIPYTLTFSLRTLSTADPIDENDINAFDRFYYPVNISFIIEMNPKDFNLDQKPIAIKNPVIAEVVDGIINKLN